MINDQLLAYVKQQRSLNVGRETIAANLKLNGWNDEDVNEAFKAIAPIVPSASISISSTISAMTPNVAQPQSGLPEGKSKGKKIFFIILILLLLGGGAAGAYYFYLKPMMATPVPLQTENSVVTPPATQAIQPIINQTPPTSIENSDLLRITTPISGIKVNQAQIIKVTVQTDTNTNFIGVSLLGKDIIQTLIKKSNNTYEGSIVYSTEVLGEQELRAMGIRGPENAVFSKPIIINVVSTAKVTELTELNSSTYLPFEFPGQSLTLSIYAKFSDGSRNNLDGSVKDASFISSNQKVVIVDKDRIAIAVGAGNANITITYGGKTLVMSATVPNLIRGDLDGNKIVDIDDVHIIQTFIGDKVKVSSDARDLNHDGVIDEKDVGIENSLCTYPNCGYTN